MTKYRFLSLVLVLVCLLSFTCSAWAAEVDCDATYCFSADDFETEDPLTGICITSLPNADTGTVLLGQRVLRPGDILTADQLAQMTFAPLRTESDQDAVMTYLPIYEDRVAPSATMTISIRGKEDLSPVAEDSALETYKNLPNEGKLKANDPEGQALTYTLVRQPKRGEVLIREDGSFTYTPKKNKVGTDSFTFTATDPAGNVSREATVIVRIMKPTQASQYTDTAGRECRFTAEWLRNTGLFEGENIGGESCFQPDKAVTQGEFLAMVIKALEIPLEANASYASVPSDTPDWLKPYLAAAIRSGLTEGLPAEQLNTSAVISGAEAAVMLQNALDLTVSAEQQPQSEDVPTWAASSLTAMADNGISLPSGTLTRGELANALYQVSKLADEAPGMLIIRMQQ